MDKLRLLFTPSDPTALSLFRMAFGSLMFLDTLEERGLHNADLTFGDENHCFFPVFEWIQPVGLEHACGLYFIMLIGTIGITLGYKFKLSCALYFGPYLYFFLLDKSRWNNHSYLFMLVTVLLWVSDAGKSMSLDQKLSKTFCSSVPMWNYFLLKFQFFILYFFAGLKKLDSDWLSGYSMKNLGSHWVFSPLKIIMNQDSIDHYFIHLGGLIYDLSCGFMLNFQMTKKTAFLMSFGFHGMNSLLFDIGMFPYVCLASLVLFCDENEFPCSLFSRKDEKSKKKGGINVAASLGNRQKLTLVFIFSYVIVQLTLPFSHLLMKGLTTWTPTYGYSWDMMVHSWETLHKKIKIRDKITGDEFYLDPDLRVSSNERWTSDAGVAKQYALCIETNLKKIGLTNIEIYFDVLKSTNGRFQQRIYDPRVNILTIPHSSLTPTTWVFPLLTNLSHYRTLFSEIVTNYWDPESSEDVVFVADFPELFLENYVTEELNNVTLSLISGSVLVGQDKNNVTLTQPWDKVTIKTGRYHKVHVLNDQIAAYMYQYGNRTRRSSSDDTFDIGTEVKEFFQEKIEVFKKCFGLVVDSIVKVVFDK